MNNKVNHPVSWHEKCSNQYRKIPIVINAVQYSRRFSWPIWFHDKVTKNEIIVFGTGKWAQLDKPCYCTIKTLEGMVRCEEGDYIIQGVKGDIYPCKPDIFKIIYELDTTIPDNTVKVDKDKLREVLEALNTGIYANNLMYASSTLGIDIKTDWAQCCSEIQSSINILNDLLK